MWYFSEVRFRDLPGAAITVVLLRQTFAWNSLQWEVCNYPEKREKIQALLRKGADERLVIVGGHEFSGLNCAEIAARGKEKEPLTFELLRRHSLQRVCIR